MFSLIVTIISIALVAALALATLYYGGNAFNQGAARAQAAKVTAQGQQIQGASELYRADFGRYPLNLQVLVDQNYLKSSPTASAEPSPLVQAALAASTWVMVAPRTPVYALTPVDLETCKAINEGSFGVSNILKAPRDHARLQCVGTSLDTLMVIQAKTSDALVSASTNEARVVDIGTVLSDPIPAADDTSGTGWLIAPDGSLNNGGTPPAPTLPDVALSFSDSGTPLGSLAFEPTLVGQTAFGFVDITTPAGQTLDSLGLSGVTVAGGSPFMLMDTDCLDPASAGLTSCWAVVQFAPGAARDYSGGYALQVSATQVNITSQLPLAGTGIAPASVASFVDGSQAPLSTLSFPDTNIGATSAPQTVYVRNSGTGPLEFDAQPVAVPAPFNVSGTDCMGQLAPGLQCSITVTFSPSAAQLYGGGTYALALNTVNAVSPSMLLGGTGLVPAEPVATVSGAPGMALAFSTGVGSVVSQQVTLSNTGMGLMTLSAAPTLGEGTSSMFAILSTTCTSTLAVGQSCSVTVQFSPTAEGSATGTLVLTTDAVGSPHTVTLQGTAAASDEYFANLAYLAHFNDSLIPQVGPATSLMGAATLDASGKFSGGVRTSGGASAVSIAANAGFSYAANAPFTIEGWAKIDGTTTGTLWSIGQSGSNGELSLKVNGFGAGWMSVVSCSSSCNESHYIPSAFTAGQWFHYALQRTSDGSLQLYINGVSRATGVGFGYAMGSSTVGMTLGNKNTLNAGLQASFDDVRVTKGIARYTAAFTPPTAAYPNP